MWYFTSFLQGRGGQRGQRKKDKDFISRTNVTDSCWKGNRLPIEGKDLPEICEGAVNQWFQTMVRCTSPVVQCPAVKTPQLLCQSFPRFQCVLLKAWQPNFQNTCGNFGENGTITQRKQNFTASVCGQELKPPGFWAVSGRDSLFGTEDGPETQQAWVTFLPPYGLPLWPWTSHFVLAYPGFQSFVCTGCPLCWPPLSHLFQKKPGREGGAVHLNCCVFFERWGGPSLGQQLWSS